MGNHLDTMVIKFPVKSFSCELETKFLGLTTDDSFAIVHFKTSSTLCNKYIVNEARAGV